MLLELITVTRSYEKEDEGGGRNVLDGISLTVQEGESLAITGPSGSGKSTLLNIMGTLDSPDSGVVKFKGVDIRSLKEPGLAELRNQHIGFVFQLHYLLPQLSLLENVLLPSIPLNNKPAREKAAKRAHDLLGRVGLGDKINRLPGHLSVGECQRGALVRALINDPGLLLADEPTGSLDHQNALQLGELLKELNRELRIATVVVTHSPELARSLATRYRLDSGKLLPEN